jgi:hypothetical protein
MPSVGVMLVIALPFTEFILEQFLSTAFLVL